MRDAEGGALLLLADHDAGLHLPVFQRGPDGILEMRHGRQHRLERDALGLQAGQGHAEGRHMVLDFAAAAAR